MNKKVKTVILWTVSQSHQGFGPVSQSHQEKLWTSESISSGNIMDHESISSGNIMDHESISSGNTLDRESILSGDTLDHESISSGKTLDHESISSGNTFLFTDKSISSGKAFD